MHRGAVSERVNTLTAARIEPVMFWFCRLSNLLPGYIKAGPTHNRRLCLEGAGSRESPSHPEVFTGGGSCTRDARRKELFHLEAAGEAGEDEGEGRGRVRL